jgi:glucokinase
MTNGLILAGDIGGTKTLLQIAEAGPDGCRPVLERRYDSHAYAGLLPMVSDMLQAAGAPSVAAACFGVAGPVEEGRAQVTNLPWRLDAAAIGAALGIPKVRLINDFQAVAYGIEGLGAEDLSTLQAGQPEPHGTRAVIGAGTGLGEGFMVWSGQHYEAMPSEGSHADFAPTDGVQAELLRHLQARFGHVSYERIVSGPGLVNVYEFLQASGHGQPSPELAAALASGGDPAAAISEFALKGQDPLAGLALDLFIQVYGAEAGNLALKVLAMGGVYVAGGIAPKIIDQLRAGGFVRAFSDKGRFAALLSRIPVHVVLNPKVGLMGALTVAGRM